MGLSISTQRACDEHLCGVAKAAVTNPRLAILVPFDPSTLPVETLEMMPDWRVLFHDTQTLPYEAEGEMEE
ncbi:hypothetical protein KIPB_010883 [Kipferlia bialata]|uniref:Uncharacterized protein n=1 Tax=Kipferlia bialata TaxID=797122 RepID=A0A9K3D769_9EUKA|nr:hypothetical protein KIPB_010883 [Kipferlia bialata]|eukprot:g10883.t1